MFSIPFPDPLVKGWVWTDCLITSWFGLYTCSVAQKDSVQCNHLLDLNTFPFTLVQARFWDVAGRGTLDICVTVWEKGCV